MKRREFVRKATGASAALALASQATASTPSADESLFYRPLTYREMLENLCEHCGWTLVTDDAWSAVDQSHIIIVAVYYDKSNCREALEATAYISREKQLQGTGDLIATVKEQLCKRLYEQLANSPKYNMHEQQRRLFASSNRAGKTIHTARVWREACSK